MTTNAVTQGFRICQSNLGVKIHDAKDPSQHLGPMFRQVIWTLFSLMENSEAYWRKIRGSEPLELFGFEGSSEPEPVKVDLDSMVERFKVGFQQFSSLWNDIFSKACFKEIQKIAKMDAKEFFFPTDSWVQILYELAATFHLWSANRLKLIELVTPLYYARVASFVRQTFEMSSQEAENLVEEQALQFEKHKNYLIEVWDRKAQEKRKK
jgi:hypothetical protein